MCAVSEHRCAPVCGCVAGWVSACVRDAAVHACCGWVRQCFELEGREECRNKLSCMVHVRSAHSYGLYTYGLNSYGLYTDGLNSYGLYSDGLYVRSAQAKGIDTTQKVLIRAWEDRVFL